MGSSLGYGFAGAANSFSPMLYNTLLDQAKMRQNTLQTVGTMGLNNGIATGNPMQVSNSLNAYVGAEGTNAPQMGRLSTPGAGASIVGSMGASLPMNARSQIQNLQTSAYNPLNNPANARPYSNPGMMSLTAPQSALPTIDQRATMATANQPQWFRGSAKSLMTQAMNNEAPYEAQENLKNFKSQLSMASSIKKLNPDMDPSVVMDSLGIPNDRINSLINKNGKISSDDAAKALSEKIGLPIKSISLDKDGKPKSFTLADTKMKGLVDQADGMKIANASGKVFVPSETNPGKGYLVKKDSPKSMDVDIKLAAKSATNPKTGEFDQRIFQNNLITQVGSREIADQIVKQKVDSKNAGIVNDVATDLIKVKDDPIAMANLLSNDQRLSQLPADQAQNIRVQALDIAKSSMPNVQLRMRKTLKYISDLSAKSASMKVVNVGRPRATGGLSNIGPEDSGEEVY